MGALQVLRYCSPYYSAFLNTCAEVYWLQICIHINYNKVIEQDTHNGKLSTAKKEDIFEKIKELISILDEPKTFAIKVDRKGEHKYTSTEIAKYLASAPFEKWSNIKVNLDNPDLEINVQIINNRSLIYLRNWWILRLLELEP